MVQAYHELTLHKAFLSALTTVEQQRRGIATYHASEPNQRWMLAGLVSFQAHNRTVQALEHDVSEPERVPNIEDLCQYDYLAARLRWPGTHFLVKYFEISA